MTVQRLYAVFYAQILARTEEGERVELITAVPDLDPREAIATVRYHNGNGIVLTEFRDWEPWLRKRIKRRKP